MGMMMENTSTIAHVILSNLINPLISSANKTLVSLSHKSKLLHLLRRLAVGLFVVVLHLLRSLPSFLLPFSLSFDQKNKVNAEDYYHHNHKSMIISNSSSKHGGCGSAMARALSQVLSLVNDVPVSSRKYDVVRSLAEKLIHDNLLEKSEALREVNCVVLSHAFAKTLAQLEAALLDQYDHSGSSTNTDVVGLELGLGFSESGLVRAARMARGWYRMGWGRGGAAGLSAEKMAAELLWLAQKLVGSGGVEVVVGKWAWTSNLGWLALSAEPRIQASLVKLTAFMIKQAKDMGKEQDTYQEGETEQKRQTNMKMLTSWLPLLCRASNGTDAPTLSSVERREIERALEEMIDTLEKVENQEKVLSLWLHHFTHCPSSDWPNLHGSYIRWCTMSRKLLLTR